MANRSRNNKKTNHRRKRRRFSVLPYVLLAIFLIGGALTIFISLTSNVDRNIRKLESAIKTYNVDYLKENTDRLPIILDVFRKSYSDDSIKEEEFYKNNFENLSIKVENIEKKGRDKKVKLKIENVNYIDCYKQTKENEDENILHNNFMEELSKENQKKSSREATVFLERNIKGYKIYESKDFINAIFGGALDYADDLTNKKEENTDQEEKENQENKDQTDKKDQGKN